MSIGYGIFVIFVGFLGAGVAGVVGLGGVLITTPLLLYGSALLSDQPLDFKTISALGTSYVVFAALQSIMVHRRARMLSMTLARPMVIAALVLAPLGAWLSSLIPSDLVQVLFGATALMGVGFMLLPHNVASDDPSNGVPNRPLVYSGTAGVTAFLAGIVGAGGGFILMPFLLNVLKIPTRIALGSMSPVGLAIAISAFMGKALVGQVDWGMALLLNVGAIPGSYLGARLSYLVPVPLLRRLMLILISLSALQMMTRLFSS